MSLSLRSIRLENFRKFREPIVIEGLTDGLNVVVEPNEKGKSTLLEALRAAFFVRHSTQNSLAKSYAPHGEAVAPRVEVEFDIDGEAWRVSKQFLRSASVEVRGPYGRMQGDEAEARLQEVLGFERDTSRLGDRSAYGALGLLWVGQSEALAVEAPSSTVRETVLSTLEAEVGAIVGGAAYDSIRASVEQKFAEYWTPTGRPSGRQAAARERAEAARGRAQEAEARLTALEQTFSDLEAARTGLKRLDRDLADDSDAKLRAELVRAREVALGASQILATRRAEQVAASALVRELQDWKDRHDAASAARQAAENALSITRRDRSSLRSEIEAAKERQRLAREAAAAAQEERSAARAALAEAQLLAERGRRRKALSDARQRHDALVELERRLDEARSVRATLIPAAALNAVEAQDRAVAAARVAVELGATRIELVGDGRGVTIDGKPVGPGETAITEETRIRISASAELVLRPPPSAASADAALAAALERQAGLLADIGVRDLAEARSRNEAARKAEAEMGIIKARIDALTPAVDALGIEAGAASLKLLIVSSAGEEDGGDVEIPDVAYLSQQAAAADARVIRATTVLEKASAELSDVQARDGPWAAAEAGHLRDLENAGALAAEIEARPEFAGLEALLARARQAEARAAVTLDEAERHAAANDEAAIARRIEGIDRRAKAASEERRNLEDRIVRLEATVESDGGKGLADRAAAAREELEAASLHQQRVTEEAETLKLLRETLEQARLETSRTFLGPVARRAKRHIERLLPGCELSFTEELSLDSVVRGGISEGCDNLSRGTQEQLAILTRLAFADMLLEQGRPVSLILDDPLVYSDDARLDLMTDILTEAAGRMQVILLTCRERAFRHVAGTKIALV